MFELIGDQCGGLLEISAETTCFSDLAAAKIKVRGSESGFLKSEMMIQSKDDMLMLRIEVVFVDKTTYEHYERQSYAHVVINGTRRRAGWGIRISEEWRMVVSFMPTLQSVLTKLCRNFRDGVKSSKQREWRYPS